MDEDKLFAANTRARDAEALLGNQMLAEAFKGLEDAYFKGWRASNIEDISAREKLFLAVNIIGKVRDHLTAIVNDGKLAAAEVKALQQTAERKRAFGFR